MIGTAGFSTSEGHTEGHVLCKSRGWDQRAAGYLTLQLTCAAGFVDVQV